MIKDGRLYIMIGKTCPYLKKCKRPCIARYAVTIDYFSCGLYKENEDL